LAGLGEELKYIEAGCRYVDIQGLQDAQDTIVSRKNHLGTRTDSEVIHSIPAYISVKPAKQKKVDQNTWETAKITEGSITQVGWVPSIFTEVALYLRIQYCTYY
jgi:hypothetical protein